MKRNTLIALLTMLSIVAWMPASAQTLHAVVFCNTIDESIGKSMTTEYHNVLDQVQSIIRILGYDLDLLTIGNISDTHAGLKKAIDEMEVEGDDVVLIINYGYSSQSASCENELVEKQVADKNLEYQCTREIMTDIDKLVVDKKPRLRVILCANDFKWGMNPDFERQYKHMYADELILHRLCNYFLNRLGVSPAQ